MALTKTSVKVTNISELSTKPNATEGLNDTTFKALFDKSVSDLKTYINETLTTEIDTALTGKASTSDLEGKLNSDDPSVTNSRKCNNTFDDATTSRSNLGLGSIATHNVTISTSSASGGSDGDIWIKYTA